MAKWSLGVWGGVGSTAAGDLPGGAVPAGMSEGSDIAHIEVLRAESPIGEVRGVLLQHSKKILRS